MTKFNPAHPVPCVYLKHGAYWLVKRNKWTRIGSTLEEALAEYAKRVSAPKVGKLGLLIDTTLAHHIKAERLANNTKAQYLIAAEALKKWFSRFDSPAEVKPRHVAQIKVSGAAHPNMTNRVVSLLRTLFGYWIESQLCDSNPCVGIKRHTEGKRTRLITNAEWWAIHEAAGSRLRAIMMLQFLTGQRIGDVLSIRRSQLTDAGIEFKQQKTAAKLVVKWTPDLRAAVAYALALHGSTPALTLFIGRRRKAPNYRSVLLQWHEACNAAGVVDAKPNDQRAQSATAAKSQGKNATKLLGHTKEAMTDRYLRDRETPEVDGPDLRQPLDAGQKGA